MFYLLLVGIALVISSLFLYSLQHLLRHGEVLIWPNLPQPALFCLLYFLIYKLDPHNYQFTRTPGLWDWVQFTAVHILRAGDILDIIEEYNWDLQNVKHASSLVATIVMAMHWMVDVFLFGLLWQVMNRWEDQAIKLWQKRKGFWRRWYLFYKYDANNFLLRLFLIMLLLVWLAMIITLIYQGRPWTWIVLNSFLLWPLDNLIRVIDVGDSFQLYNLRLDGIEVTLWTASLAVAFRLFISLPIAQAINWIHVNLFGGVGKTADDLVQDLNNETMQEAVMTRLVTLGKPAIPSLLQALARSDARLQQSAIMVLGRMGTEAVTAIPALVQALADWELKQVAAEALHKIDPQWSKTEQAKSLILVLLSSSVRALAARNLDNRRAALAALEQIDPQWSQTEAAKSIVPTLTQALKDPRSNIREAAAIALGQMGAVAAPAIPKLLVAFANDDLHVRLAIASALGQIGPAAKSAVPTLISALDDPLVHEPVALSLGQIGTAAQPAIPALVKILAAKNSATRKVAEGALDRIDPSWIKTTAAASAVDALLDGLSAALPNTEACQNAIRVLNQINPQWQHTKMAQFAIVKVLDALIDADVSTRQAALKILDLINPYWPKTNEARGMIPILLNSLACNGADVGEAAALALNRINPQWRRLAEARLAIVNLVQALMDESADIRKAALRALARIDSKWSATAEAKSSIPVLVNALLHNNAAVRAIAAETLNRINPRWPELDKAKAAIPELTNTLMNINSEVRAFAAEALNQIDPQCKERVYAKFDCSGLMRALVEDPNPEVRKAAEETLVHMGPGVKYLIPGLVERLVHWNSEFRTAAAKALYQINPRWFQTPEAISKVPLLVENLVASNSHVRESASNVLDRINPYWSKTPEASVAIPALILALANTNGKVREAAATTLGQIGSKAEIAVSALEKELTTSNWWKSQMAAAIALGQMGPAAQAAVPTLLKALTSKETSVRKAVEAALDRIDAHPKDVQ